MLTKKQNDLLIFIRDRLEASGVSPSFDEMKDALGLRSKSGVHRLISALEERGFIRRLPHRARALEVLRAPEPSAGGQGEQPSSHAFAGSLTTPPPAPANDSAAIPLYGRIAAGTPIEALRDPNSFVDVPATMLARRGETFALEIEGDSMVDAGILDGDTAIIVSTETAETGDIVVALVDGEEATLKRFRRQGSTIALEPANSHYPTQRYPADRVAVQGRLIALYRSYI